MPDNSDDKILECAIAGRCNAILTFNAKDFPEEVLKEYGLVAMSPGDFLKGGGLR